MHVSSVLQVNSPLKSLTQMAPRLDKTEFSIPWNSCDEDVLDDSYYGGLKMVLPMFRVEA